MPTIVTPPETVEMEQGLYHQEHTGCNAERGSVSQSRFSRFWGILHAWLRPQEPHVVVPTGQRFESGLDMLSQKYPYLFIRTLCG